MKESSKHFLKIEVNLSASCSSIESWRSLGSGPTLEIGAVIPRLFVLPVDTGAILAVLHILKQRRGIAQGSLQDTGSSQGREGTGS